jgi:hypothetical protein
VGRDGNRRRSMHPRRVHRAELVGACPVSIRQANGTVIANDRGSGVSFFSLLSPSIDPPPHSPALRKGRFSRDFPPAFASSTPRHNFPRVSAHSAAEMRRRGARLLRKYLRKYLHKYLHKIALLLRNFY